MIFFPSVIRLTLATILISIAIPTLSQAQELEFNKKFEQFLQEYRRGNFLDYKIITTDEIEVLDTMLHTISGLSSYNPNSVSTLINAYNFLVVREIASAYPIKSVQEVPQFFTKDIALGDSKISLDNFEKKIVELVGNPLAHLLLNCGARGCPSIQYIDPEVSLENYYRPALKEEQVMSNSGDELQLSQIFFWYAEEFGDNNMILDKLGAFSDTDLSSMKISFIEYDWSLNDANATGQSYYPTKLYGKGGMELQIFNNYYSQDDSGVRYNFFSSFFQLLIGTNKKLNYGFDVKVRSVNQGDIGLFSALQFKDQTIGSDNKVIFSRTGISGIGPRIKYQPFERHPNISFIHAVYFVPMSSAEGNLDYGYSDYNNLQFFNQVFFEKEFTVKRRLFIDIGLHIENIKLGVHRNENHFTPIQFPITAIYSYFPNTDMTIYGLANFAQRLDLRFAPDTDTRGDYSIYGQIGAGLKYFLTDFLEVELLYTNFMDTTPGRTAHTFNLGLRLFRF